MITPSSMSVIRTAERLVEQAKEGTLGARQRDLFRQAKEDPRRVAELVAVLAALVAFERPPDVKEAHARHLREAHAAYTRGVRAGWVVSGEREYQRNKKRIHRWRARWATHQSRLAEIDKRLSAGAG